MMATSHTKCLDHGAFICIAVLLLLTVRGEGASVHDAPAAPNVDESGRRLTREYHLRQGALRGLLVRPGARQLNLPPVEAFLGVPYAAPPLASLRFMPPVSAPPWPGVRLATRFAPVCPQSVPPIKKENPPSLARQAYRKRLMGFLKNEAEDCLYLNIYVPHKEQRSKRFPVLVFIHGDSFEFGSGNPYDGRVLAAYGGVAVVTLNHRLGILGFLKPSLTEHAYGNSGLLDQLAALQWLKDNVQDLGGDPDNVTLMGHGVGAAGVNYLMLSPISNGLFHRAILMSGSSLSDWALTKDPGQYTLQVAQSLGCNPTSKDMMACLQNKPLSEIKRIQILARDFETPLGPIVAGSFIPTEPSVTVESYPNLLSRYQLLCGVTELESYHDFGVIELDHGVLENQRDDFITKYAKVVFDGAESVVLKEALKFYSTLRTDPQRWSVEHNRDFVLDVLSDVRVLAPMVRLANYHSRANRHSYLYVFRHNSVSTDYASLNKSVNGEELPYVFGVPLGGANSHFHSEYTQKEKLLSEVTMRLFSNFVKIGTPNTQSLNQYYSLDRRSWNQFNVEWPEYNVDHQSYLRLDIPPTIRSFYRSNYTRFWLEELPSKIKKYIIDPLFEYTPPSATTKLKPSHKNADPVRRQWNPPVHAVDNTHYVPSSFGKVRPYASPERRPDTEKIYREIQSIKTPARPLPPSFMEKTKTTTERSVTTTKPETSVKTSEVTITLIVSFCIIFLVANIVVCSIVYIKKKRMREQCRDTKKARHSRADLGDIDMMGKKSPESKSAIQSLKNSCTVIKTLSIKNMRSKSKIQNPKEESCKTPKSDDSGGFRERFQLRRHLSTSTLDANTKVRDWITNEVMHRCSPNVLHNSNNDMNNEIKTTNRPFTRSEEVISEIKPKKNTINTSQNNAKTKPKSIKHSPSALGSQSISSDKKSTISLKKSENSTDSLKSKGSESVKSKKVSVAIDATPAARTISVLQQEPIEITKSFDVQQNSPKHSISISDSKDNEGVTITPLPDANKSFTSVVNLSLGQEKLKISHKHSTSDPVSDVNYDKLKRTLIDTTSQVPDILPPTSFRNDINVTSKDESTQIQPLSPAESLLTIQRRNFPKVLPDLPRAQKRLSLQPSSFQTFGTGSMESQSSEIRSKVPPQPPPRTTTLERRLAYKNSRNNVSSFTSNPSVIPELVTNLNYENIDTLSPPTTASISQSRSFDSRKSFDVTDSPIVTATVLDRKYPTVIIASRDIPNSTDSKVIIQPSPSQFDMTNAPRVRLPDDFHSQTTGSITSFSSMCSDDDNDDFIDDLEDDELLQELVGSVDTPIDMNQILDSKGPESMFERKLEIVPVKLNTGNSVSKSDKNYVCISDLQLPDVSDFEKTAQIKPNFGLNKLTQRSESIHKPPEMAIKVKPKRSIKPSILNKSKNKKLCRSNTKDGSKIEHSNSGSSNDTETSTGTVINRLK